MKKKKKTGVSKKKNIFFKILSILLLILFLIASSFIIYFEILPLNFLALYIIGGGLIIFLIFSLLNNKKLKKWIKVVFSLPSVLLIILFIFIILYSLGTINFLNDILDMGFRSDTYSVYVLNDSPYENISDINKKIIGVSEKNEDSTKKAIEKVSNKIEFNEADFDSTVSSLDALINNEIDAVIAMDSNVDILKEDNDQYDNVKAIYSFTINTKVSTLSSNINVSKENFVLYLSGIDVNGNVAAKAKSDVNILVAVNPKEKKILMVNTPRDYYVKLKTKNSYDKLTHAGVYGIEESIGTLENLYDINIDYYARVNFTSFINIVEKLDGIEVDVPVSFCEQTSSRTSSKQICLKKGLQKLNGEQALALARTRHTLAGGDRSRIENQLLVLQAIIDKAISPNILVKYNDLLSSLSNSVVTNMEQRDITKLIKNQIKDNTSWDIETYTVDGTDSSSTTYSTGSQKVYVMKPKEDTVLEAKKLFDKILETNKYTENNS